MTVTVDQLRNLADRAARGLTPDEQTRLRDGINRLDRAENHIRAALAIHQPQPDGSGFPDSQHCQTCSEDGGDAYQYLVPYPCPTVTALTDPAKDSP
jgi:hypothetical protein